MGRLLGQHVLTEVRVVLYSIMDTVYLAMMMARNLKRYAR